MLEQKDFERYYERALNALVTSENYFNELLKDLLIMWYNTEKKEMEIPILDCVLVGIYGELYKVESIVFSPISNMVPNGDDAFNHFHCKINTIAGCGSVKKLTIQECISQNPYNTMKFCRAITLALIKNGTFNSVLS